MKKLLFVFAGLAFALTAAAQEFRITHGPYLCDMSQDGVTVVWTTNRPALSWVEASPADSLAPAPPPRHYQTVAGRKLAGRTLHAVRVRGLQPGTDYRYRIFSQEVQSWPDVNNVTYGKTVGADASRRRAYGFRTFPAAGSGCSFLVLNDIHGKADVLTRLCKRVDFSELGFVAFNGDMSSSVESGEQLFKDYLDASAALFAAGTPILFTRGNHETRGVFADSLGDYFPGRDGRFYGIYRYGDVCILLLDCGEDKPDDHAEYNGLADYDAYRAEECAWLKKGRALGGVPHGVGAHRPAPYPACDRGLARERPPERTLRAGAQRGRDRPDALRPRPPLFVPSRRGTGREVPDRGQRQPKLRALRCRRQPDPRTDRRSPRQDGPYARISAETTISTIT